MPNDNTQQFKRSERRVELRRRLRGDRTRGFATGHRKGYDRGGEDV